VEEANIVMSGGMGYSADYFPHRVARWLDSGYLFPGAHLIEFGAQEFYCDPHAAGQQTLEFLLARGVSQADAVAATAHLSIAACYRALGICCSSIDVDGSRGSAFFDLNTFAPPADWLGTFDMVNNGGTIEHLVNPMNGFQVAHELLKPGGVAHHSIPLTGWPEHGLFYPTSKFYDRLIWENAYEVLDRQVDPDGPVNQQLTITYRKRGTAPFRAPFDHLTGPDAYTLGAQLTNNWLAYSARRFNGDQPTRAPMSLRRRLVSLKWRLSKLFQ
jgi:SAM-dependent methyltransferase